MKVRRILLFVAAFLAVTASAPSVAAHGFDVVSGSGRGFAAPISDKAPERDAGPKLSALPALHRARMTAPGTGRRFGDLGIRLFVVGAPDASPGVPAAVARVDPEADARLLRASNTPCRVRGPPAAA